jgi:galactofuranosylgalactofuranosylrhamnosyl-N-acetylglucosaminyl-diphospho-decaprenol beta-1,5/1,6-galactofuranosyltransferase
MMRPPGSMTRGILCAALGASRAMRRPKPGTAERPEVNVSAQDARWYLLAGLDSATVSLSDGSGVAFRHREPATFRRLFAQATGNQTRLVREWGRLQREYLAAMPELTSEKAWDELFFGDSTPPTV